MNPGMGTYRDWWSGIRFTCWMLLVLGHSEVGRWLQAELMLCFELIRVTGVITGCDNTGDDSVCESPAARGV